MLGSKWFYLIWNLYKYNFFKFSNDLKIGHIWHLAWIFSWISFSWKLFSDMCFGRNMLVNMTKYYAMFGLLSSCLGGRLDVCKGLWSNFLFWIWKLYLVWCGWLLSWWIHNGQNLCILFQLWISQLNFMLLNVYILVLFYLTVYLRWER